MSVAACDGVSNDLRRSFGPEESAQCIEDFKKTLYKTQDVRRKIVHSVLSETPVDNTLIDDLKATLNELMDSRTTGELRHISTPAANFPINIQDEIRGLRKDIDFLTRISLESSSSLDSVLESIDFPSILAPFHPISPEVFYDELDNACRFLMDFVDSSETAPRKPFFITDWDGTMKDYCSQYATNLQPVYSAVTLGRFSKIFTRATAVLTAGPLRGPGILDLTALPINGTGPVLFSGSWGREWWMKGRRVVHENGISDEAFDAISRLSDEMTDLLQQGDFAQFALVGSGVQRKVDRLTLGVQTVFGHVPAELTARYIEAVKERMHRVDPNSQVLTFEDHNHLEVEICAHSQCEESGSSSVWNKADGVKALIESLHDSLCDGRVLVAGDTPSDVPMLKHVMEQNPEGAMGLFVGANEQLKSAVRDVISDESRVCFVSSPDVAHAAFARIIASKAELD